MHKGFRVGEIEKPGNMGKFAKWYKCELLKKVQDQTGAGVYWERSPGYSLAPQPLKNQKSHPPTYSPPIYYRQHHSIYI
nr:MAG TPA: hypothetical protein [Caudoviricetes sp.]